MTAAVGIIQARMGSERLPGKILAPLVDSVSLLEVLWARLESSSVPWWLATTEDPSDDRTAALGEALGMRVYRGSSSDVLSRFTSIVRLTKAEAVVRVTADNPFTHGATVNRLIESLARADGRISCLRGGGAERRFPLGFIPEAVRARDLLALEKTIRDPQSVHRTHVTSGIPSSQILFFDDPSLPRRPLWRWTIDTALDMEMARASFYLFRHRWPEIGYSKMVEILDQYPEIVAINAKVEQRGIDDG